MAWGGGLGSILLWFLCDEQRQSRLSLVFDQQTVSIAPNLIITPNRSTLYPTEK